jgi:maltose alpha-D-glucosyltransferase/alpha-amylase
MTTIEELPPAEHTADGRRPNGRTGHGTQSAPEPQARRQRRRTRSTRPSEPVEADWYKDAIIYEVPVRAFMDSDGDGRGDLRGLTSRLDYLQQLGVTALWLLPFYPSPLRDDGYDIADYTAIHPDVGTLADFRNLVEAAHRRGIRIITELVLNHTSDQHVWFQRSRQAAPGSYWRNYYVWSDTPHRYAGARIIFKDFEHSNWTWDPVAGQYFWHRFYSHQPDLNYEHPAVRRRILRTVDFWLGLGVDGLRLDAVPYLYEADGTDCENLPETHGFLKELRHHIDERFPGRMLLAEANQWPEDAREYFGNDDECHMAFHFPLMPRLFMGLRMEDRFPIIDILQQTPEIPPHSQWALFLRNHDELTLEMVTDEERDYMYRAYASDPEARINLGIRRRLAPLLHYHRQKMELMHGLLLSLPGTPVLYYGDEIGMGDNVYLGDRNGVRTPMQWSGDRNAGFSDANPQRLYLPVVIDPERHYESVNVAAQLDNPDSMLRWVRRTIALRKRHRVLGRGRIEFVPSENPSVLAFVRADEHEQILVVANLSRFAQFVELGLSGFKGRTPLELFGHRSFPAIGDLPYLVTLGPYSFYWFALPEPRTEEDVAERAALPELRLDDPWWSTLDGPGRRSFANALPAMLVNHRWYGAKDRRVQGATIAERFNLDSDSTHIEVLVVDLEFFEGEPEHYLLPVAVLAAGPASDVERDHPEAVLARTISPDGTEGRLVDAHYLEEYGRALMSIIAGRRRRTGVSGTRLIGATTPASAGVLSALARNPRLPVRPMGAEQSNTSLLAGRSGGDRAILKAYRRLQPGLNPEVEIGRHLRGRPVPAAALLGWLELERGGDEPTVLGVVHEFCPNEGDAWTTTLRSVGAYLDQVIPMHEQMALPPSAASFVGAARAELPHDQAGCIADLSPAATLLGRRTAELHLALADAQGDETFRPEPPSALAQRSLYQSSRSGARRTLLMLRRQMRRLPADLQALARPLADGEGAILAALERVLEVRSGVRMRVHGDLHLGQVLFTGRDFFFVDFEGEPVRSLGERRLKRSALTDVAGMLRSYHYAAHTGVVELDERGGIDPGTDVAAWYRDAADAWAFWSGAAYLHGYLATPGIDALLPATDDELEAMLVAHLLDKALYEVRYELANRPDWAYLPLIGVRFLLDRLGKGPA